MPYYVCPKCGSKDSYEATEIVSEYQKGGSTTITGPENDLGFQPSFTSHQDGETSHRELIVRKCRQCDCLLGSKDLRHTEEEIRLKRESHALEAKKAKSDKDFLIKSTWIILFVCLCVIMILATIYADDIFRYLRIKEDLSFEYPTTLPRSSPQLVT